MRNILISGATGFLGSNLIEILSKKNQTSYFGRKKSTKFKKKRYSKI